MHDLNQLDEFITNALREDIGDGDHSSLSCIEPTARGKAILKVKEGGIMAGIAIAERIFKKVDSDTRFITFISDGSKIQSGDIAFEVYTSIHNILKCERVVLNCMQRMSGIATLTNKYVEKLASYHSKLLDTRKTTPNFRLLEKEAVRIGGGTNHRFGLYDMIMLKDNHIDYCGSIEKAIEMAYHYVQVKNKKLAIEIETRNLEDVEKVMKTGKVDRIMLDNFTPEQITEALSLIQRKYETEASGGIHFENIESFAATGVDFISCGAITHHAVSLDLSLKAANM
jgi:nicotinate-nucleotide pyrophosphorylase (carboxylating)